MSISEREAENAGPECAFQRLRLDMDDVRDAYIAGRTAEPCKEQVEAALAESFRHPYEVILRNGAGIVCACGEKIADMSRDENHNELAHHKVKAMLEAARKAVM